MFVRSTEKDFEHCWNQLYRKEKLISPLYSEGNQSFYGQRLSDEGKQIEDKYFILLWEGEPVVGFRGATVVDGARTDLLAYEIPCIAIEARDDLSSRARKAFLTEFDRIAETVTGNIAYRDFLIDGALSTLGQHLVRCGASERPHYSKVIDLRKAENELWQDLRKSYSSLINWGLRELQPSVLDSASLTWEQMQAFRELHIAEAGRETRSEASWRRQLDLVQAGEAFVVFGLWQSEVVSAGLFIHSQAVCYYGVSVSRRDLFEKPMFHAVMWRAILHAKALGCRWFEVGQQVAAKSRQDPRPSKKELGISEFKAGFGGRVHTFLDLELNRCKET